MIRTGIVLLPVLLLACAACSSSHERLGKLRGEATVFAPLDLPGPNSIRTGAGLPGPDYWQQRVDYSIRAELNADSNTINGRSTVTYHNNSPDELSILWLHLEQNIFREDSIGRQRRGRAGGGREMPVTGGYTNLEALAGDQALQLTEYDTRARIELSEPIAARGGVFEFDLIWTYTLADGHMLRHGVDSEPEDGAVYELAQWFPAVAVYDDVHGWNAMPYVGGGEFYTNFGDYEVAITVPRDHLVVASGELQNPDAVLTAQQISRLELARASDETMIVRSEHEVSDPQTRPAGEGPLTWRFIGRDMRTFAWASSASFIWDACGVDVEQPSGETARVLCQSVYPKEHAALWARSTEYVRHSIAFYSDFIYPYPYPQMTNVKGVEGGMEYPMLIFCRGTRGEFPLFSVTDHEVGHTWFPMLVNNDERRHAWMDEGLNTFMNHYSQRAFWDRSRERYEPENIAEQMLDRLSQPILIYPDHAHSNGFTAYSKPGFALVVLRDVVLGAERFDPAFRKYVAAWAWKSPQPADFFRVMESETGAGLSWFWRAWFAETTVLDQAVASVHHEPAGADGTWRITAILDNRRDMVMPVPLRITYEDGSVEDRTLPVEMWFTTNRVESSWVSPMRAIQVEIDPDMRLPDVKRRNNRWSRR